MNYNFALSPTLFLHDQCLLILKKVTENLLRGAFYPKPLFKHLSYKMKCAGALKFVNEFPLNTHS